MVPGPHRDYCEGYGLMKTALIWFPELECPGLGHTEEAQCITY